MESCRIPQQKLLLLCTLLRVSTRTHTPHVTLSRFAVCVFVDPCGYLCGRMTAIAPTHSGGDGPAAQLDTTVVFHWSTAEPCCSRITYAEETRQERDTWFQLDDFNVPNVMFSIWTAILTFSLVLWNPWSGRTALETVWATWIYTRASNQKLISRAGADIFPFT